MHFTSISYPFEEILHVDQFLYCYLPIIIALYSNESISHRFQSISINISNRDQLHFYWVPAQMCLQTERCIELKHLEKYINNVSEKVRNSWNVSNKSFLY